MTIAKNQNTFAKRNREMEKKRKADDKRADRLKRKTEEPLFPQDSAALVVDPYDGNPPSVDRS